jgi:transcriptional regulator with XRE-family HTH domain
MTTNRDNTNEKTLANAIRQFRVSSGFGVRELSRRSGVAAPQISRLERGEVKKPTVETLVSLARGLDWNPIPLLILAGYVEIDEARARLREYFVEGSELIEEWRCADDGEAAIEAARKLTADPSATLEQLQELAFDVWLGGESGETLWDDLYAVLPALGENQAELRAVVSSWSWLSTERRRRVVEFVRDQVELSKREFGEEMKADIEASAAARQAAVDAGEVDVDALLDESDEP